MSASRSSQLVGANGLGHRQFRAAPAAARDHHGDRKQQDQRQRAEADQGVGDADRKVANREQNLVHAASCSRFAAGHERRGNVCGKCCPDWPG
jgi:hypothetical protein